MLARKPTLMRSVSRRGPTPPDPNDEIARGSSTSVPVGADVWDRARPHARYAATRPGRARHRPSPIRFPPLSRLCPCQKSVASRSLSPEDYYKHLLRLIYRLLFLMVIEERDLVFPPKAPAKQRDIYTRYYSLRRLRLLSERRYLADPRKQDLWLGLLTSFRLFEADGPGEKLGLAPLAGDLFGREAIGPLVDCTLGNDVLLGCLRSLSLYEHPENRQLIRVNYAALNVEEFGSVYEGLLKYEPSFSQETGKWSFALAAGSDDTQSHYTPDDLVQPLIKHSLDYLIAERLKAPNPEAALLDLRVADIACGSGHILLAAARRIATDVAVTRTGEEQPSPSAYRKALRDVIRNCVYGVDLNPSLGTGVERHETPTPLKPRERLGRRVSPCFIMTQDVSSFGTLCRAYSEPRFGQMITLDHTVYTLCTGWGRPDSR
jgi:hypothetical protein